MKIFKFGGASVKDAEGVKNVAQVLQETGTTHKVVVISAMGKTTNALEKVIYNYFENAEELTAAIQGVKTFHHEILEHLFKEKTHSFFQKENIFFEEFKLF